MSELTWSSTFEVLGSYPADGLPLSRGNRTRKSTALQMQRWMMRIFFEESETRPCDLLNLYRELRTGARTCDRLDGSKLFRLATSVFGSADSAAGADRARLRVARPPARRRGPLAPGSTCARATWAEGLVQEERRKSSQPLPSFNS